MKQVAFGMGKKNVLGRYYLLIFMLIDFVVSSSEDFMRQKLTLSIWAALLAVTISHADDLCVQLCTDCSVDPANATCSKVDQVCGSCPAILDSVQHVEDSLKFEQARKDSIQKEDVRKLAGIVQGNCQSDTCNFMVVISEGMLNNVRGAKGNKAKPEVTATPDTLSVPPLPPMTEECRDFCGTCLASKEEGANPICEKIESQCRCSAYAEHDSLLAEKAKADSVAAIEKALAKMEASQTAAQEVFDYCSQKANALPCSVTVKLRGEDFAVVQIQDMPKKEQPVVVAKDSSAAPKDTVAKKAKPKKAEQKKPVAEETPAEKIPPKKEKRFYMGASLGFEYFTEKYFGEYAVDSYTGNTWSGSIGFLVREYLAKWAALQVGINFVYHDAYLDFDEYALGVYNRRLDYYEYGEGFVDYYSIMFDFPLQLRFGIPLKSLSLLFFSTSFHVRKPFYADAQYEINWGSYWKENSDNDFYTAGDWEFLLYLGFGVEITRTFSVQWQFAPMCRTTYTWVSDNYGEGVDVWRISMDLAW